MSIQAPSSCSLLCGRKNSQSANQPWGTFISWHYHSLPQQKPRRTSAQVLVEAQIKFRLAREWTASSSRAGWLMGAVAATEQDLVCSGASQSPGISECQTKRPGCFVHSAWAGQLNDLSKKVYWCDGKALWPSAVLSQLGLVHSWWKQSLRLHDGVVWCRMALLGAR